MKRKIFLYIFILCISQLFATDYVVITEVMYDTPLNEDTNRRFHNYGEFIELYNTGDNVVDLSGWSIETTSPHQVFTIPTETKINPRTTLVVAYGLENTIVYSVSDMTEEEFMNGMTDFHWLYGLTNLIEPQIVHQTILILPNQHTTLLLKNNSGITMDSVIYENPHPESLDNARNKNNGLVDGYRGCLRNIYSLQRMNVSFVDDAVAYRSHDWLGEPMNSPSDDLANNSLGYLPDYFYVGQENNNTPVNSSRLNYIQEITPNVTMSSIDTADIMDNSTQAIVKRTYYDGMYRPTFTFLYNQTPTQDHLVTLKEYDSYARPTKEWLPIVTDIDNLTHTTFKENSQQFYNNDTRSYIEQSYSTESWSNGITKNELVGTQKAGADMLGHKMSYISRGNNSNEVKLFSVTQDGLLQCSGYYHPKTLRVTETIDEDGKAKLVYTNLQDQIVMETVDAVATYYVYNDLNQMSYVLPPLVNNLLAEGVYTESDDILKKYAYLYKYDNRGNQIYKRLPGCEPILMVYDQSNALVMTQTGNQRARGTYWTVYKYDQLRRPIYTAEIKIGETSHADLLDMFNDWLMLEYFSADTQTRPMENTGYSSGFFSSHPTELLTVNYYDNYEFLTWMSDTVKNNMEFAEFEDNISSANANGLLTGTRTYYLTGAEGYTETVYYYDYRGREIQRRSTNHLGGYDVLSTKYDFANNVTDTWSSQSTSNGITTTEHYHYEYDHANRLLTTTYSYNDEPSIELQTYHYDELGRVRSRHIHDGIDSVAFNYDIRNQVTQIKSSGYEQNYYYNQSCPLVNIFSSGLYNGNISATTWTFGNKINGYVYSYDKMNRLISNKSIINGIVNAKGLYSETFNYDAHGNILRLTRWDDHNLMNNLQLTYEGNQLESIEDSGLGSYEYNTKQYHDNNNTSKDFSYDANGNLIYDQDRGIAAIRYNLLNLPDTIQFTNGNLIIHRYDAIGNRLETKYLTKKIAATVPLGNVLSTPKRPEIFHITRDAFCNNIVYTANDNDPFGIKFVHNSEGFIRYYGASEHYHFYHIKDLLGNIRETYIHPEADYKECVERTQYYPSGLPWVERLTDSFTANPWKYNGKEFVEMHSLDEYDSKARWYYPAICRTTTMDPLAEKYYPTSPYAWCGNNPMRFVDPDGKKIVVGTWYGRMFAKLGVNNFEYKVQQDLDNLKTLSSNLAQTINTLENSEVTYYILLHTKRDDYDANKKRLNWNGYNAEKNAVYYDPDNIYGAVGKRPPKAGLMHELGHAENDEKGKRVVYNKDKALNGDIEEKEKWNKNEKHSIELENEVYQIEGLNIKRDEEYIK